MKKEEVRYETYRSDDADIIIVAYGTTARISISAIDMAREKGIKAGLIRPISLFPFPEEVINEASSGVEAFLTVEMSLGQMVEDVRLAVNGQCPVHFFGRTGGIVPSPEEIFERIIEIGGGE
ncbi:MAG TPA: transketolase C-terminal domain-containing protein, partial [Halanaerobiales bacterium]|nr:transketolase C-terminal domain-containing protein [Halanaerobiales bacterium]